MLMAAFCSTSITSCAGDDFTETIFPNTPDVLNTSAFTYPLDTFCRKNFLDEYNMKFLYKMEDVGADMQKNLVPARYERCCELAVLTKYMWYDAYKETVGNNENDGREFLRSYSPRILHVIGSPSYNPTSGTKTLGLAEGGVKITLLDVNKFSVENLRDQNIFHTMHHEFSHSLAQNRTIPVNFRTISNGKYDPNDWGTAADSVVLGRGFISPYASSAYSEDWVEVISYYITFDSIQWADHVNSAAYEWEEVAVGVDSFNVARNKYPNPDYYGYINYKKNNGVASTSGGVTNQYYIVRKIISRDENNEPILNEDGTPTFIHNSGVDGKAVILQKLDICKEYLKTNFNYDLDKMRDAVQKRMWLTDDNGNFIRKKDGTRVNRLLSPDPTDAQQRNLIDVLLDGINQYKTIKN